MWQVVTICMKIPLLILIYLCLAYWSFFAFPPSSFSTAEPPRKDGGDLLLSKLFLDACSSVYAVFPSGQENQGQSFALKYFNVIDPLRVNNNLGRSVSKGVLVHFMHLLYMLVVSSRFGACLGFENGTKWTLYIYLIDKNKWRKYGKFYACC